MSELHNPLPKRVADIRDRLRSHLAELDREQHPDVVSLAVLDLARERKLIPPSDDPVADPVEMLQIALRNVAGFLDEERLGAVLLEHGIRLMERD